MKFSASQISKFLECPRSWFLTNVCHLDSTTGGLFLTKGEDFDLLVQATYGGYTFQATELAQKQLDAARKYLPEPSEAWTKQFEYEVDAGEGFIFRGKPDLRMAGSHIEARVIDTKTTSDRGENRGAANDRPAYALTDAHTAFHISTPKGNNTRPLKKNLQAKLYAWAEFKLDPELQRVHCLWVYVNKDGKPKAWSSQAVFERAEVLAWFESEIRPILWRMRSYHQLFGSAGLLAADHVPGNLEHCHRCWVREHCHPFTGPHTFTTEEIDSSCDLVTLRVPQPRKNDDMAFQLDDLNDDLAPVLAASVAKVQATKEPESPKEIAPAVVSVAGDEATSLTSLEGWTSRVTSAAAPAINRPAPVVSALIVDAEDEPAPRPVAPLPETPTVVAAQQKRRRRTKAQMAEAAAQAPAKPSAESELVEEMATIVQGLKDFSDRTISDLDKVLARLRV